MLLRCVLLSVVLGCLAVGPKATAQVDQENVVPTGFGGANIAFDVRQEFTPTMDQLDTVELYLAPFAPFSASGSVAVSILRSDLSLLATSNPVHIPGAYIGTVRFRFAQPVPVIPGQVFWLKPTLANGSPSFDVAYRPPGYAGGRLFLNGKWEDSLALYFREGLGIPAVLTHPDPETARTLIEAGGTVKLAFDEPDIRALPRRRAEVRADVA